MCTDKLNLDFNLLTFPIHLHCNSALEVLREMSLFQILNTNHFMYL